MQAGRYRHRVTFQSRELVPNEINEMVEQWSDFATVWASVEPARGSEYYAAKQLDSKVDGIVYMRYREGILPTMRMMHKGRTLHIVSIVNVRERNRELQIPYTEALD